MIFTLEDCQMIAAGIKTQACWVVKGEETLDWVFKPGTHGIDTVFNNPDLERIKWQVGKDYAVQLGRGKGGLWINEKARLANKLFALHYPHGELYRPLRIRITAIDLMRLRDLTVLDFEREGGYAPHEFPNVWNKINPKYKWKRNSELKIWRLQFEVVR